MKTTSLIFLVCSLFFCLSGISLSQTGTFTVHLPDLYSPQNVDSITVPNGRPIYALLVSGYGRNGNFDELHFYNFARKIMAHGGYVHYAWWNNLLAPFMERPLHNPQSYPGNLADDKWNINDPTEDKALPGEDFQFVSDARKFLTAIQAHNPNAIIIVVGHSMGGGAIIHLTNAWTTDDTGRIDILGLIDPVGNRDYPWAGGFGRRNHNDYNWTRWRATHDFLGYKSIKDVDPRPLYWDCQPVGNWIADYNVAKEGNDLLCGNEPYIHPPINTYTFNENVVHLYHRWQTEAKFPFDYSDEYTFGHNKPPGGSTFQQRVITKASGQDIGGWPEYTLPKNYACCPDINGVGWPKDGHGEIVGYRGPVLDLPTDFRKPVPLAVRVRTSPNCGTQCPGQTWPWRSQDNTGYWHDDLSSIRKGYLEDLENIPAGSTWEHLPYNPDLCLVSDGLKALFNQIVTDVNTEREISEQFSLEQNYPNPFNPSTTIKYDLPEANFVSIKVYDVLGLEVGSLVNEQKQAGKYELNWNAANLPSGVYFYRLQAGDFVQTRKMILLK